MIFHLTAVCVGMAAFIAAGVWAALRSADDRLGAEAPGGATAAVAFAGGGPATVVRDESRVAAPRRDADEAAPPLNDRGISDTDVRAWCRQEGENFLRIYEVGASITGWLRRPTRGELAYTLAHADARFDIANHLERGNLTRSGLARALEQGRLARERMNVRPKRKRAYTQGREDALLDIAFQLRMRRLPAPRTPSWRTQPNPHSAGTGTVGA